jgi:hypothetical protein
MFNTQLVDKFIVFHGTLFLWPRYDQHYDTENTGSEGFTALSFQTVDFRVVTQLNAEILSTESKCVER